MRKELISRAEQVAAEERQRIAGLKDKLSPDAERRAQQEANIRQRFRGEIEKKLTGDADLAKEAADEGLNVEQLAMLLINAILDEGVLDVGGDEKKDVKPRVAVDSSPKPETTEISIDLTKIKADLEKLKKELGGQMGEVISLLEKVVRLLENYPAPRPEGAQQRINAIIGQISVDEVEMVENGVGASVATMNELLAEIRKAIISPSIDKDENNEKTGVIYEFVDPSRDDLSAYVAEWKRLWDLAEGRGERAEFISFVNDTLARMESEINDFMDRAKFSEKPVGTRYKALKTFFNNMGYSYNKDSGEFSGKVSELKALYTYLHNRLSLADHFHLNGVSSSMYAHFEEAVKSSFPEFGRYVTDYFLGTSIDADKRVEETEAYKHYRVVRVLDQLMTQYYDETPYNNNQIGVDSSGSPVLGKEVDFYIARNENGGVIAEGYDKRVLEAKYGNTCKIEEKYSGLSKEQQQRGYFSFGRGAWMSSGGGYKQAMMERLRSDFSCLSGVRKVVEGGEEVFYYGPAGSEIRLPKSKLEESLGIAIGINALSATRAEVFASLYYAIGKSPNDDKNLDLMYKCYPLAKELNLAKESVLEIPYIVLGGDVPDRWLATGAKKIGLMAMILSSPTLRRQTGINSEADFFAPTTIATAEGVMVGELAGIRALRELDASVMRNPNIASELGKRARSLDSDFPRFRNILRSIYISRLKRDLLKLRFEGPNKNLDGFRTAPLLAHKRTELSLGPSGSHDGDFIRPFVMPPRMIMVETDIDLDLSKPDKIEPGRTASDGLQFHSNIMEEYEAAANTYKIANESLPSLTGNISHDVEIIVKDLEGLLKQTSLMKKDDKMIDWVYFFELLQMRITRLIFLHREKYQIFQRRLIEPHERLMGRPISSTSVVHELKHYIENSGQTGVGGEKLIFVPQFGREVNLKVALLSLLPDEDFHEEDGQTREKVIGPFWGNIRSLFTAEGYNTKSLIGKTRVGMYAGGIEQRSMILEVQRSAYAKALSRYQLTSFLNPETAVLTNTGMLNSGSATVKSAKESQDKEKK